MAARDSLFVVGAGEIANDGDETLTRHAKNAVLVKGSKKKARPGEEDSVATHYMKMAKRGDGMLIDLAVAAVEVADQFGEIVLQVAVGLDIATRQGGDLQQRHRALQCRIQR